MMILCVEGHVSAGDFLDVLDYEDSLVLAEKATSMLMQRRKAETESMQNALNSILDSQGAVVKSVGHLSKLFAKAFSKS